MTRLLQDHRLLGSGRDLRHELTGLGVANEDREGRDLAEEDPTITPIGEEADTGVGDRDACESRRVDHSNDGGDHIVDRGACVERNRSCVYARTMSTTTRAWRVSKPSRPCNGALRSGTVNAPTR